MSSQKWISIQDDLPDPGDEGKAYLVCAELSYGHCEKIRLIVYLKKSDLRSVKVDPTLNKRIFEVNPRGDLNQNIYSQNLMTIFITHWQDCLPEMPQ